MADSKMQVDEKVEIDEGLYSRQLYVLGHEAMKRMQASNVLIVGMKGLGVEIAKDLCLAGVKSVTVHDPEPVEIKDLSSQFYLREEDVGKPRAEVSQPRLAELNNYVPVHLNNTPDLLTDPSNLSSFQVVVLTNTPLETQIKINDYCHQNKIHFVSTDVRGLFGSIFCDFGEDFTVVDATGENAVHGIIADIDEEGLVTALDETRHGLETGDYVQFTEVEGIEGINNADPVEITVKGPYTFQIDRSKFPGQYQKGGLFTQVKMPKFVKFQSLAEQIKKPELLTSDFAKFDRPLQLHIAFQALDKFASKNGRLPAPMNASDAEEVYATAKELAQTYEDKPELDEKLIKEVAFQAQGDVPALSAIFGGLAAQEVLKAISGKFHPIVQFLYFDSLESLPTSVQRTEESCKPIGSRYDGQIAVFGKEFQEKIGNIKEFLVGAGAIGCEMLKNWAMIGLATGPEGKIYVTDMDSIEKSNLNRQFLFRPSDVGKLKSDCASDAVTVMNPDLSGKITAMRERVGPDTENIFNDDFWHALDGVTNALDNVDARTYVDRRCVFFMKPLLESGTLGTKGNTQVVLPRITESYSSSTDPPEQSFPMCTLRSFPNRIEHTIAWARDLFESFFAQPAQNVNLYLSQPNFIESTLKQAGNQKQILESIKEYLVDSKPLTFEECIQWARREFEKNFNNNIQQLLYNFPKDSKTSSGALFWSGPKRAPDPLTFDVNNKAHLDFIVAAANLHAFNYGLKGQSDDMAVYYKVLSDMVVPDFTPSSGVKIQEKDTDPDPNAAASTFADNDELQKIVEALPPPSSLAGYRLTPVEFEKDDPTNHHIDFITAASNLRAMNYGIQTADKHKTKFIAGRILPAMVTTTALVAGLVILELYKLIDGKTDPEQYKNGFVNLALPFFGFSEPISSPKGKYLGYDENGQKKEIEFDKLWDRFEVEGDVTLQEFLDIFEKKGLTITMLSSGVSLLYASFFPPKKRQERTVMRMTELVENVSKKAVPSHANSIIFEICADDLTEEDVEIPYVMLKLPAGKQVVVDKGEK